MDGNIRVLDVEMARGIGNIEAKSKKAAELKGRSLKLDDNISQNLENVQKSIEEIRNESSKDVIDDDEDMNADEKNEQDGQ